MLIHDIRYDLRQSSNYPGFTHTVVDTMGFSMGANTAMLTASESVRWRAVLSHRVLNKMHPTPRICPYPPVRRTAGIDPMKTLRN